MVSSSMNEAEILMMFMYRLQIIPFRVEDAIKKRWVFVEQSRWVNGDDGFVQVGRVVLVFLNEDASKPLAPGRAVSWSAVRHIV